MINAELAAGNGEITDAERHFFILDPRAPAPATDRDALRDRLDARQRAAEAAMSRGSCSGVLTPAVVWCGEKRSRSKKHFSDA